MEGRPLDDQELVDRSKKGDADAYSVLVDRYQAVALRAAYVVTGSRADAEDAVQEAFVKAYLALGRFRDGAPFKPWLLRIVTNEAKNRRRSRGRREDLGLRAARERPSGDAAPSPEEAALRHEDAENLLRALRRLRTSDRLVIAYRYWLGLDEAEMAAALGCARGTVKSRLSRALERLRAALPYELTATDSVSREGIR